MVTGALLRTCRFCDAPLRHTFVDLGMSPLANSFLRLEDLERMEPHYPLHARVCESCYLVQLPEFESPERIFSDYAYFSSYSDTWLEHCRRYAERMTAELALNENSLVLEIASNDGALLQCFKHKNVPVLGIEPAINVAAVAQDAGIPTLVKFFGTLTASELVTAGRAADLVVGNNVLAHAPYLNDFVAGLRLALKPGGTITMEFPHLLRLMDGNQFDTIYHEHFSYFSFLTVEKVFAAHGLTIFDVEELPIHGGSLRLFACHAEKPGVEVTDHARSLKERELTAGLQRMETYDAFAEQVRATKRALLEFLIDAKREGKHVAGYGAPAKGNTLLNYCGVRTDLLDYTVDRSPHKQGRYLPGTHIPIFAPEHIRETKPDYLLVLPWNIKDEIATQMAHVRDWGCRFVVPVPRLEIVA